MYSTIFVNCTGIWNIRRKNGHRTNVHGRVHRAGLQTATGRYPDRVAVKMTDQTDYQRYWHTSESVEIGPKSPICKSRTSESSDTAPATATARHRKHNVDNPVYLSESID